MSIDGVSSARLDTSGKMVPPTLRHLQGALLEAWGQLVPLGGGEGGEEPWKMFAGSVLD